MSCNFQMEIQTPEVSTQDMERWDQLAQIQHVHLSQVKRMLIVYDSACFTQAEICNLVIQLSAPDRRVYVLRGAHLRMDLQLCDLDHLSQVNMRIIRDLLREQRAQ